MGDKPIDNNSIDELIKESIIRNQERDDLNEWINSSFRDYYINRLEISRLEDLNERFNELKGDIIQYKQHINDEILNIFKIQPSSKK